MRPMPLHRRYGFWYVMRVRSRKARLVEDHSCGAVTPVVAADLRRRLPVNSAGQLYGREWVIGQ
jgi:hypothetical protein